MHWLDFLNSLYGGPAGIPMGPRFGIPGGPERGFAQPRFGGPQFGIPGGPEQAFRPPRVGSTPQFGTYPVIPSPRVPMGSRGPTFSTQPIGANPGLAGRRGPVY